MIAINIVKETLVRIYDKDICLFKSDEGEHIEIKKMMKSPLLHIIK